MDENIQTETQIVNLLDEWEKFYKLLKLPVRNFSSVRIPEKTPKQRFFARLIIFHGDLTYNRLAQICKSQFEISFPFENMENATRRKEERYPTFRHAIWVRDYQEADMQNARKSWRDLLVEENMGMNLREVIIFHLKYFLETGKHLDDKKTATLCSSTQFPENKVPYAYFDLPTNTLVIKQCEKEFFGKDENGRDVRSRSFIGNEF